MYLEAIGTLSGLDIIPGKYLPEPQKCPICKETPVVPKEKMTDVNIAIEMLIDAQDNKYDIGLLISADTDLVPIVEYVSRQLGKPIMVAFPPKRYSDQLKDVAYTCERIKGDRLGVSPLPPKIRKEDNYTLERPREWIKYPS